MITAKEISDFVEANRTEAIERLQELLRTPSVTGDEEPVSFVFEKRMKDSGLNVDRIEAKPHRPNLLALWEGSQKGKTFVFNGHMDVFPPDPEDPGMFGPWSGKEHEGCIYGRGASDMKGGDAGALMAVIFLRKMGFDPKGNVLLSWMCDEEFGGELGVQYLLSKGYLRGDFGICMEPSDGMLVPQHGGILRGYISYKSEPGHTALLYKGKTALQKAVTAIGELEVLNSTLITRPSSKGLPPPHLTIAVMNSGKAANVYPSEATFWFDRRLVPGENHDEALKEITDVLDALKKEDDSFDYQLTVTSRRPLLDIPKDDPFIQLVAKSYKEVMGKDVEMVAEPWGSDAAWIRKVTHMPIPNFGAANGENEMGKANEKISTQKYLDFIKVYMMTVVNALS